jgi:two-component system, cell cycle sensor histidine kinase and response regulator CckA
VSTTKDQIDVLLVEDDEEDYLLTKDLLSRLDGARHQIHWVSDSDSALRAAREGDHDVYLVDYRLGPEDGIDLVRELVAAGHDVPVIVLTGQGNHDVDVEAARAGAVDYLVKGEVTPTLLERTIRYAMRGHADMRALRESEEGLRQAQRMEAVGQLAGGIAHDFNNLLTVISGYTEILQRRVGEAKGSEELAEVGKAAEQAALLTRQLLAYSRKQVLEPRVLDLNGIVSETQTMLERVIGENIEFSTRLAEDLGSISADNGQIEQIIMNLVVNARDAMPDGGTLLLETGNTTLPDTSSSTRPATTPGDYVLLAVTDTGQGMDAATAERIFEPFFTTKERGAGTGLGLSTVYGIVEQSDGHIEVESEPGIGTTFRLYFPHVAEEAEALNPKPLDERLLTGPETVLLVEDEEAIRAVARAMLETYGYTVLLAGDGAAALELAQNHPGPIQLLMTDILMPKMGGIELAERLSAVRPELKILYTSGYSDSNSSPQRVEGAHYLQKPYAMKELARTVRELLDSSQAVVSGPLAPPVAGRS